MSYAALFQGNKPVENISYGTGEEWVRPDWPALEDLTSTDNVLTGIYGVEDHDSNFVSILIAVSTGTWSIDWGDGTIETGLTSNVKRDHLYNYSSIAASPVGTFKPVVVKVTTSGGNITTINFVQKHSQAGLPSSTLSSNWLDIALNASSCTTLTIGATSTLLLNKLKKVKIYNYADTNLSNLFYNCSSLESINLFDTQNVTNMNSMFYNCTSLKYVPLFNTQNVTDMSSMFRTCSSLKSVPLFNTQNVTTMLSMFHSCSSLMTVPVFNTSKVTDMSYMFYDCDSLQVIPSLDTSKVTTMSNMCYGCSILLTVPSFVTTGVTDMSSMFNFCYSLPTVPLFNTSGVTSMSSMFSSCYSLTGVPLFDTSSVSNMSNMFNSCPSVRYIPQFNTKSVSNMIGTFNSCFSLSSVSTLNCTGISSAANIGGVFSSDRGLAKANMSGIRYSISYGTGQLSSQAINTIFSGLGTAAGASGTQTIEVRGNYGYSGADKSIAEAKGWLVL
jgi:surface protein